MFLTTSRGAINLDHVREITWPVSGSDKTVFHFANGETETVGGYYEPLGPVIAAAPGASRARDGPGPHARC